MPRLGCALPASRKLTWRWEMSASSARASWLSRRRWRQRRNWVLKVAGSEPMLCLCQIGSRPHVVLPVLVQPRHISGGQEAHGLGELFILPVPPGDLQQLGDLRVVKAAADPACGIADDDGIGFDVAGDHRARADHRAVSDLDAGHDDGFGTDPDVMPDHGVSCRLVAVARARKLRGVRDMEERKAADPVVAVPLIAGHDKGRSRADRAEAADDQLVGLFVRQQIARTVIKAVAVIVAGVVAVAPDDDVGVRDLLVERDALEGAFKIIGHEEAHCGAAGAEAMRPIGAARRKDQTSKTLPASLSVPRVSCARTPCRWYSELLSWCASYNAFAQTCQGSTSWRRR